MIGQPHDRGDRPVLELGLLLHTGPHIRDDAVQADFGPVIQAARQAEELGFEHVWLGDSSRMERGWPRADCIAVLTALAMATTRIRVGVVPLSAPLRNPVLLAHQLATVDVLSRGRLLVSPAVGKGGPEGMREFANCGVPFVERGARLTEMLQIMKRLWTEPSVSFAGRFFHLEDASVFPKPLQRPIPLYVATGRDERALRRAGRFGDGWFTTAADADLFRADRQKVNNYALEAGRNVKDVSPTGLFATFHLERDGESARRHAPEHLQAYFGAHGRGTTTDFFGSPPEIAERLQAFVDGGLTMVAIRFVDQDLTGQAALMREVVSALRDPTIAVA